MNRNSSCHKSVAKEREIDYVPFVLDLCFPPLPQYIYMAFLSSLYSTNSQYGIE